MTKYNIKKLISWPLSLSEMFLFLLLEMPSNSPPSLSIYGDAEVR